MSDTPRTTGLLTEGCSNKQLVEHAFQLERELAEAIACKVTAERLLNEAEEKLIALREGMEKLAAKYDNLPLPSWLVRELRALLK